MVSSPEHEHMTCKMAVEQDLHSCSGRSTDAVEGDDAQLETRRFFVALCSTQLFLSQQAQTVGFQSLPRMLRLGQG